MADKKIIAVAGATGAQGGGLVRAILGDPGGTFAVRALTRDPGSEKARRLASMGAEVVAADVDDLDSVTRAFAGRPRRVLRDLLLGALLAGTRAGAGHQHGARGKGRRRAARHLVHPRGHATVIPADDPRMPTLLGRYKVPHFDSKGEADHVFTDLGVPTTFLLTSFYWENLVYFGMNPKPGPDGILAFTLPMGDRKLPGVATEDIGRFAYGIFKRGPEFIGRTVGVAGDHLTGAQMAAALTRALGQEVRHNAVPPDVYRSFGFPGAEDLGNMFQFNAEFESVFCGSRDLAKARAIVPGLQTFDQWLAANAARIPLA